MESTYVLEDGRQVLWPKDITGEFVHSTGLRVRGDFGAAQERFPFARGYQNLSDGPGRTAGGTPEDCDVRLKMSAVIAFRVASKIDNQTLGHFNSDIRAQHYFDFLPWRYFTGISE